MEIIRKLDENFLKIKWRPENGCEKHLIQCYMPSEKIGEFGMHLHKIKNKYSGIQIATREEPQNNYLEINVLNCDNRGAKNKIIGEIEEVIRIYQEGGSIDEKETIGTAIGSFIGSGIDEAVNKIGDLEKRYEKSNLPEKIDDLISKGVEAGKEIGENAIQAGKTGIEEVKTAYNLMKLGIEATDKIAEKKGKLGKTLSELGEELSRMDTESLKEKARKIAEKEKKTWKNIDETYGISDGYKKILDKIKGKNF